MSINSPYIARADIFETGSFAGTHSDDFNYTGTSFQTLVVMDGLATLTNLTPGGAIKIEPNSGLNSDWIFPRSQPKMMGQPGILRWDFAQPVSQFGSWFENNSFADDAVAEFLMRKATCSLRWMFPRAQRHKPGNEMGGNRMEYQSPPLL